MMIFNLILVLSTVVAENSQDFCKPDWNENCNKQFKNANIEYSAWAECNGHDAQLPMIRNQQERQDIKSIKAY